MATFRIRTEDGATYRVEAGDEHEAMAAIGALHGGVQEAPAKAAEKPSMSAGEVTADVAKTIPSSVAKTAMGIAGLPGDAVRIGDKLVETGSDLAEKYLPADMARQVAESRGLEDRRRWLSAGAKPDDILHIPAGTTLPGSQELRTALEGVTGKLHDPQSTLGQYVDTGIQFAPGMIGGGGSIAARLAARVAAPAIASETAGQLTKGSEAEPYARMGAALLTPGALAVGRTVAAPVTGPIRAHLPFTRDGFIAEKEAQLFRRAGMTPQEAAAALDAAASDKQGMFTLADALGMEGRKSLAGVASIPHEKRQMIVDALERRQATQGRRIVSTIKEGFDAPETAMATEAKMMKAVKARGDAEFGATRADAVPADVTPVIAELDKTLAPGASGIARPGTALKADSTEAALQDIRDRLTDGKSVLTEWEALQRVRSELSGSIKKADRAGDNNKARLLGKALSALDSSMEKASAGFRQANRNYAQGHHDIEAIAEGKAAAVGGRTEDIIPAFQAKTPQGQIGYRAGYADKLIGDAQGVAPGVNKARPLMNDAFQDESAVMAPGSHLMQRRIERENTMFETRNKALGGSDTARLQAEQRDLSMSDPHVLGSIATGHYGAAAKHLASRLIAEARGLTPRVAERMAETLMETNHHRVLERATAAQQRLARRVRFGDPASMLGGALLSRTGGSDQRAQ